jgi:hypothetical protein
VTLVSFKLQTTRGKCAAGTPRVMRTGKVTGGTGAAAKRPRRARPRGLRR